MSLDRERKCVELWTWIPLTFVGLFSASFAHAVDYESTHNLVVKREWAEALPLLEPLSLQAPHSTLIHHDLAQTLLRLNRRAESMKMFRRFGSNKLAESAARTFIHQESYRLYQEGLNFLETNKLNLARERLEKAYEMDRDQLEILLRLVQVETLDLRPDSALRWAQTTRALHGNILELLIWEGKALQTLRRYEEAAKKLTAAVRDLPESENAAVALAETLQSLKDEEALTGFIDADLARNADHVKLLSLKIKWELDQFDKNDVTEVEMAKNVARLESQVEKLTQTRRRRLESEQGLELLDFDQLKQDLAQLKTRAEDLEKR